ncbi:septation ring formation regulator EzrA [Bombilactobacillus thymidiniphilus]|uniref:Septation ring formation regulator EzrA n=1 Tax=Bombilactobacillus thymidiniphilus TaxID=2923363 RepID=A0ABY4PDX8_9LACO|nr:septation ring formation regulator EzrA [Bombilactobacillus thymidiniphilus]UQS83830.1 septation ring formation regulator EzrA [Bombilactobacillus thymidiniphilus]
MAIIIVLIIVIIAIILGIFYFYQKNLKAIDQITSELDQLNQINFDSTIQQVSNMKLAGASLARFEQDCKQYQQIKRDLVPQLQTSLITASESNSSFKIWSAHKKLQQLQEQVAQCLQNLEQATVGLKSLFTSIQQNQVRLHELQGKVEKNQQFLVNSADKLGAVKVSLQAALNEINDNFDRIIILINNGDALAAQQALQKLTDDLKEYQDLLQSVEQRLQVDFQAQVAELQVANKKMRGAGIHFPDPQLSEVLVKLQPQLLDLNKSLVALDFEQFDKLEKQIAEQIDYLYERVAKEWRAKKKVQKNQLILNDFINHANHQNRFLRQRMERLSKQFALNEYDRQLVNSFEHKLQEINQQYQKQLKTIRNNVAVYSDVLHSFQQLNQQLQNIEQEQVKIDNSLNGLVEGEKVAQNSFNDLTMKLDQIKHRVTAMRLKGLPKSYLKSYQIAEANIKRVHTLINSNPLNVEELTKQVATTNEALNNLESLVEQLINDIVLTTQLLQYSNRYLETVPAMEKAIEQTQALFDQQFDYAKALATIEHALEQVEPGAVERIKQLYITDQETPV